MNGKSRSFFFIQFTLFFTLIAKIWYTYNGGRMKKVVINILIILYFLVTIIVTYSLLSYNKYNIVETNDKYVLTLEEENKDFKKSDLIIIKKSNDYKKGDFVFYYDTYATKITVKYAKIGNIKEINNEEQEITLEDDLVLSSENILGKKQNTTSYKALGVIFNTLTSKWGYLFIIIFPMLIAFVYELYAIFKEIKKK